MDTWREMPVRYICKPEGVASTRRFETLCLFHFFDVFSRSRHHGEGDIDLDTARDFTKRWGVLRKNETLKGYEAVKFKGHTKLIIEIDAALLINRMRKQTSSLITEYRQRLERSEDLTKRVWAELHKMGHDVPNWVVGFQRGPGLSQPRTLKAPDMSNFNVVIDEYEGVLRPHLEAKDLASALTVTALLRGRDDYTECYFLTHSKKTQSTLRRKNNCKRWVLATGRPGRTTRYWCSETCREAVKYDEKLMKKGAKK